MGKFLIVAIENIITQNTVSKLVLGEGSFVNKLNVNNKIAITDIDPDVKKFQ